MAKPNIVSVAYIYGETHVSVLTETLTTTLVTAASDEVYKSNDMGFCYRTGRAVGYSSLEKPELKKGDKTILSPGMVFAVDGGVTIPGKFGARVGDTILVTENGSECITEYPRNEPVIKG